MNNIEKILQDLPKIAKRELNVDMEIMELDNQDDTSTHAIVVSKFNGANLKASPVLRIDSEMEITSDEEWNKTLTEMAQTLLFHIQKQNINPDELIDVIKTNVNRVRMHIRKKEQHEDFVGRDLLNLKITYAIPLSMREVGITSDDESETVTVAIKEPLLKDLNCTEEELFQMALANGKDDFTLNDMNDFMKTQFLANMLGIEPDHELVNYLELETIPVSENALFTYSNKDKTNGAEVLANIELLLNIREKFNADFYILPSSIHEVLLVPINEENPYDEATIAKFTTMVTEINENDVDPKEQLSNNIYIFMDGELKIA